MTNTPSVEGDRLERIKAAVSKRLSGLAMDRRRGHSGDPDFATVTVNLTDLQALVAALPCKGGEDATVTTEIKRVWEAGADWGRFGHASKSGRYDDVVTKAANVILSRATPTTEADTGRGLREALEEAEKTLRAAMGWFSDYADGHAAKGATDKAERNAGRGLACLMAADQALAALSDTPSVEKQA